MEDAELIQRFKDQGDKRAFEKLIGKYSDRIFRFGFKMCGHREDAEDVVQDTFVSAYRYLDGFRGDSSVLTWLMKIASSACLKKRRLRKNQPRHHDELDESRVSGEGAGKSSGDTPDSLVISAEKQARFRASLGRLPEHYRVVVVLRDLEGLSVKETAEALDLTESAVKVRLHRARAKLFKLFSEENDDQED